MHFYRRWQPVKALSFDLDDTLYDNGPAIVNAEQWLLEHLKSEYLACAMLDKARWLEHKRVLLRKHPELCHDVSACREQLLLQLLHQGGMALAPAQAIARDLLRQFLIKRSMVNVSEQTHQLLRGLAERYPLFVITNGNLDLQQAGLSHYFSAVYKAGGGYRMKPCGDMFMALLRQQGLAPQDVLHIGDHPITDVQGARLHGFRAAWLNDRQQSSHCLTQLPDVELAHLTELTDLLL